MMPNYFCSKLSFTSNSQGYDDLRDNMKLKVEYCESIRRYNTLLIYKRLLLLNALVEGINYIIINRKK